MNKKSSPRIGLALGSGSARGWAHVGVIRALQQAGITPDIVCGTSSGALVGAAYASGELDGFEAWLLGLGMTDIFSLMDMNLSGGMMNGERLMDFFSNNFIDRSIDELDMPFATVATDMHSGAEIWLREGSTLEAVRASIALPALFTPVMREGRILVDGGLVNPVPVSLARAMGADVVIAVDLNSDILSRHQREKQPPETSTNGAGAWMNKLQKNLSSLLPTRENNVPSPPAMIDVVTASLNIMQMRISRSRMAGDPPEIILAPRLAHLGLLDFHRAREAIDEGWRTTKAMLPGLRAILDDLD